MSLYPFHEAKQSIAEYLQGGIHFQQQNPLQNSVALDPYTDPEFTVQLAILLISFPDVLHKLEYSYFPTSLVPRLPHTIELTGGCLGTRPVTTGLSTVPLCVPQCAAVFPRCATVFRSVSEVRRSVSDVRRMQCSAARHSVS